VFTKTGPHHSLPGTLTRDSRPRVVSACTTCTASRTTPFPDPRSLPLSRSSWRGGQTRVFPHSHVSSPPVWLGRSPIGGCHPAAPAAITQPLERVLVGSNHHIHNPVATPHLGLFSISLPCRGSLHRSSAGARVLAPHMGVTPSRRPTASPHLYKTRCAGHRFLPVHSQV
jgi:hypothetical protein